MKMKIIHLGLQMIQDQFILRIQGAEGLED